MGSHGEATIFPPLFILLTGDGGKIAVRQLTLNNCNPEIMKSLRLTLALCFSVLISGCVLAPGAHLNPNRKSNIDFNLVDISEDVVLPEPVSRQVTDNLMVESDENYEYLVGPHDILSIRVWNSPDLTASSRTSSSPVGRITTRTTRDSDELIRERQQVTPEGVEVASSGKFFYPYAGNIQAAGKTVEEIRQELTRKLAAFVVDPQISVKVQEFNSQQVQVLGEVKMPRPLAITSKPLRVLDAIALAEGLKDSADKVEATLIRKGEREIINLARLLEGDLEQNHIMTDGDVLNVDTNRYRQIVILGEVSRPIAMPYDPRGLSLNDALVAASGIHQMYANAKGIYILRNSRDGSKPSIFRLDMENATGLLLADRFPLEPRDVVYVDTAGVARWNRVINQIIPTSQFIYTTGNIGN